MRSRLCYTVQFRMLLGAIACLSLAGCSTFSGGVTPGAGVTMQSFSSESLETLNENSTFATADHGFVMLRRSDDREYSLERFNRDSTLRWRQSIITDEKDEIEPRIFRLG